MKVTIFKGSSIVENHVEFYQLVSAIQTGKFPNRLFAPSGVMSISGNKKNILIYSGLVLLKLDTSTNEELKIINQRVKEMSTTRCCFKNHLNNGVNVLVKTDCLDGHHKTAYKQVLESYQSFLGLDALSKEPDEKILCQLSHDSDIYYNPESRIFEVDLKTRKNIISEHQLIEHYREEFEYQVKYTQKVEELTKETWQKYYRTLASNCYNAGIPVALTLDFILRSTGLNKAIKGIVKRTYRKLAFGKEVDKEPAFSILFKSFLKWNPSVEPEKRIFIERIIYNSLTRGIPHYYTAKTVMNELGLKRTRRESIESFWEKKGLLTVYTEKQHESDRFPKTYYRLRMENYEAILHELMTDPAHLIRLKKRLILMDKTSPAIYSRTP
ncbi:BT4734/BF3469 family protein [uncultured Draconibacterium sp.]|uniref:BT4734/BF3469 family protein n=1 Tax=uncultured Draconibacterium sp. TaxID=1573823 RepID=UPI002AA80AF5|nr:BT4734/BF3469 family protein [uncultured Draconibacterium sp.]